MERKYEWVQHANCPGLSMFNNENKEGSISTTPRRAGLIAAAAADNAPNDARIEWSIQGSDFSSAETADVSSFHRFAKELLLEREEEPPAPNTVERAEA
ncbi:hypothetical protein DBV15_08271 [Temnothorax longispinosus]|uniref:Uncharacterized protein n=1 Tax=Temnothorax longispinosus TaxID=300112 RepID=A0A4S2KGI1_9HYME|nr:hypothetical protein DBV15_08271 [Temnothorax longispinosus]